MFASGFVIGLSVLVHKEAFSFIKKLGILKAADRNTCRKSTKIAKALGLVALTVKRILAKQKMKRMTLFQPGSKDAHEPKHIDLDNTQHVFLKRPRVIKVNIDKSVLREKPQEIAEALASQICMLQSLE